MKIGNGEFCRWHNMFFYRQTNRENGKTKHIGICHGLCIKAASCQHTNK